jgi:asparagine synthetase B (glutamine-hydrolysing)
MCGIVFALTSDPNETFIHAASEPRHHRRPDGGGFHLERHRGPAPLDPGDRGLQPMQAASGRYTILFNGEIHDCRALIAAQGARAASPRAPAAVPEPTSGTYAHA